MSLHVAIKHFRRRDAKSSLLQTRKENIMTEEARAYVSKVKVAIQGFDLLDLTAREKIDVAAEIWKEVDWVRFRGGLDKECYECMQKNLPDAIRCVNPKCGHLLICEACASKGEAWRCSHAGGPKMAAAIKMIPKRHVSPKERPAERDAEEDSEREERPKRQKPAKFSFGE